MLPTTFYTNPKNPVDKRGLRLDLCVDWIHPMWWKSLVFSRTIHLEIFMNLTSEVLQHELVCWVAHRVFSGVVLIWFPMMLCLQWLGEVGVIALPELKLLLSLRFKVRKCLSVKHAPKSGVPKHDHYDHHTMPGAHRPPSRDPLHHADGPMSGKLATVGAPCLTRKRVGVFGWFFGESPGNSLGTFWDGEWIHMTRTQRLVISVTSKDWRRKFLVTAWLKHLGGFIFEENRPRNAAFLILGRLKKSRLKKNHLKLGGCFWENQLEEGQIGFLSYKVGPKDPVISRVITPFVGVKNKTVTSYLAILLVTFLGWWVKTWPFSIAVASWPPTR